MPVKRLLIRLAFPSVLTTLTTVFYSLTDTFFLGKLGTQALGALTVSFPVFAIIGSIGLVFGIGGGSVISRFLGAGQSAKADTSGFIVVIGVLLSGGLVTVGALVFLRELLVVFGSTTTILPVAVRYARILVFGSFITIINMAFSYTVRAEGNAVFPMIAVISGTVVNIILDPVFIFMLGMGVEGAGVATISAQSITGCFYVWYYSRGKSAVRIRYRSRRAFGSTLWEIMKIGAPSFINQGLLSGVIIVLNSIARHHGDAAVGAVGVVMRVLFFAVFLIFGFCRGLQPIAGFNYGAGELGRVKQALRTSVFWLSLFSLIYALMLELLPVQIMSLFGDDAEVVRLGARLLRGIGLLFPFFGFEAVMITLHQALGYALPAAVLALVRQGILLVPVVLLLYPFYQFDSLVYGFPLTDFLVLLVTVLMSVKWLRRMELFRAGESMLKS